MKNSSKLISQILAAGTAGVAFFQVANSSFVAALPGDVLTAIAFSAGIIGLAVFDYSRRIQPLTPPTRALRPALTCLPAHSSACNLPVDHHDRIAA